MKKTMKHLTKLTLTSTTPEHIGLKNRPRYIAQDLLIAEFDYDCYVLGLRREVNHIVGHA